MQKLSFLSIAMSLICFSMPLEAAKNKKSTYWGEKDVKGDHEIYWHDDFKDAEKLAKKDHKPLLLFFTGSDWCGWCKKMNQEIFNSQDFYEMMERKFIFVEIDFPMRKNLPSEITSQNSELKKQYEVKGFPTIIILDPTGSKLLEVGYRPGGGKAFAEYLQQQLPDMHIQQHKKNREDSTYREDTQEYHSKGKKRDDVDENGNTQTPSWKRY